MPVESSYESKEELLNVISHGLGILLSIGACYLLLEKALRFDSLKLTVSYGVFGAALLFLYTASTLYHSAKDPLWRHRLKIMDHIAIFVLIAGTYTPFVLITLQGRIGWIMFGVAWGIALFGSLLKLLYTGRYTLLSTGLYLGMGWIIIFAFRPLVERLPAQGISWLFSGGIFYTLGAVVYCIHRLKYNHALFHLLVLLGSFSHFVAIYKYVNPVASEYMV